jgi:hypothetical protein
MSASPGVGSDLVPGGFGFPTLWSGELHLPEMDHDPDGRVKYHMGFRAEKSTSGSFGKSGQEQVASRR